jgi:hypothetical protein
MPIHPVLGTEKLWVNTSLIMISTLLLLLNGSVHINAQSESVNGSGNGGSISAGSVTSGPTSNYCNAYVQGGCDLGPNGGSVSGSGNGGSINGGATSSNSPPLVQNSWKIEATQGIQTQYPNNWNDNANGSFSDQFIVSFSPNNDSNTTVQIYKGSAPGMFNLGAHLNQEIDNNDSNIDYNGTNANDTNATIIKQGYNGALAGHDAYEVEFTYQYNGTVYQDMMVGIVTSGVVYYIDFDTALASYAVYLPVVQRMLDSFQVTG